MLRQHLCSFRCKFLVLRFNFFHQGTLLSWSEALLIVSGITNGVAYLHSDGVQSGSAKVPIAHRDLKSTNILVRSDGTCVISDFGLAVSLNTIEGENKNVSLFGNCFISVRHPIDSKYSLLKVISYDQGSWGDLNLSRSVIIPGCRV